MKPVSVSLFAFTLALSLGAAITPAKAEIQYTQSFPAQAEIDVRKIVPSHLLNRHAAPMAEVSKIDVEVYFDVGSDKLNKAGEQAVARAATIIKSGNHYGKHVVVEGNTDSTGKPGHNQDLSYRRALRVVTTLVRKYGVPASMLSAKGYGSSVPVATNSTKSGKAANRRVTFSVVQPSCNR